MPEQPSVLPFPRWLIVADLIAALLVVAGLLVRNGVIAADGLPPHADLLLLAIGAAGVLVCGAQFGRHALAAARSKSSR